MKLAGEVRGKFQLGEALRFFDELDLNGDRALVCLGSQGFGIVGNVGGLHPVGTLSVGVERKEAGFGFIDEFTGVVESGGSGKHGSREKGAEEAASQHDLKIA